MRVGGEGWGRGWGRGRGEGNLLTHAFLDGHGAGAGRRSLLLGSRDRRRRLRALGGRVRVHLFTARRVKRRCPAGASAGGWCHQLGRIVHKRSCVLEDASLKGGGGDVCRGRVRDACSDAACLDRAARLATPLLPLPSRLISAHLSSSRLICALRRSSLRRAAASATSSSVSSSASSRRSRHTLSTMRSMSVA